MSQQNLPDAPEWLKNHNPPPGDGRGNPNWHKGMKSPNPHGRKADFGVPRTKITAMLMDNVGGILEKQIAKALEGDSGAATLVLSRVMAPLKADSERVRFHFDPALPISQQVEQVLAAIAAGAVAPDVGKQIIDAIAALSSVRANEDLEQRIIQLEARAVNA
jgi:hypothetical protein